jgi:hypothetical protein
MNGVSGCIIAECRAIGPWTSEIVFFQWILSILRRHRVVDRGNSDMQRLRFVFISCVGATCAVLICSGHAHAYIDPGTGSYILQIVIAGLVGAAFTFKLFWKRLQVFFSKNRSGKGDRREDEPSGEDE